MCGQKKIKNFSVNTNAENPASSNTGASNQPLITVGMLERLNGDEKGDAIVSVRGYEPIWTKFTPSYELKDTYFKNGKADMSKREAVLFNKDDYVFDIDRKGRIEDKILDEIEEEDNKEAKYLAEQQKRQELIASKWNEVVDEIHKRLNEFVSVLTAGDCRMAIKTALENKDVFLYSIAGNYKPSVALQIRTMADYIKTKTAELDELNASSAK